MKQHRTQLGPAGQHFDVDDLECIDVDSRLDAHFLVFDLDHVSLTASVS